MKHLKYGFILITILLSAHAQAAPTISKFDEFGDINCDDEYARLDNFGVQLQNTPSAQGYIIFYGGRRFRSRLPRVGEAAARAGRLKPYLVSRRGIPAERVIVINGGYRESFQIDLWIVPLGSVPPEPSSTLPAVRSSLEKAKSINASFNATFDEFTCELRIT